MQVLLVSVEVSASDQELQVQVRLVKLHSRQAPLPTEKVEIYHLL
jgi:hypothetical protein